MRDKSGKLSVSEFAKLHEVNKRTLHYYDKVGLFEPKYKESNHYRYYDCTQSIHFENIRMLRELNMSIDEIKRYLAHPDIDDFMKIADDKINELNRAAIQIERTIAILEKKKQQLELCRKVRSGDIRLVEREEEYLIQTRITSKQNKIPEMMAHLKKVWEIEEYKVGCGSYISLDKIREKKFERYDGIYTPIQKRIIDPDFVILPRGRFLCAYHIGRWEKLPHFYENILAFAREHKIELIGNAYELGLNEFVIKSREDYLTQILIQIQNMS